MEKIEFKCEKCQKAIKVQRDIFEKTYADSKLCLSCRSECKEVKNEGFQKDK